MEFFDILKEWTMDGTLAIIGIVTLIIIFIASFFFRTAWGHWHTGKGRRYEGFSAEEKREIHDFHKSRKGGA